MNSYGTLLRALEAHGKKIVPQGPDRAVAQCPAHADGRPSLSVRQGDRGTLLYCFAGCQSADVVAALGLTLRDLFESSGIEYEYQDRDGRRVRTVRRKPDKSFSQSGRTRGTSTLYRLPQVLEAVAKGTPVFLAEGEKDVHHLEVCGVVATTTPGGANAIGKADLSPLEGADVRVVPDRDQAGEKYAREAWGLLLPLASKVTFLRVPVGKDFTDAFTAGLGVEDLEPYVPEWAFEPAEEAEDPREAEGRRRVVTTSLADVEPLPVRWTWRGRVPQGELTVLAGREGLGKSTFAAWLAARVSRGDLEGDLSGPREVLWVTSEDSPAYVLAPRLTAAGADLSKVHHVTVALPLGGEGSVVLPTDLGELAAAIERTGAALVVLDPITSTLSQTLDTHKDHSLRAAFDPLRVMAERTGAAVLGLHHVGKKRDGDMGDRMLGARTFAAAARSVLAVLPDPEDQTGQRKVLTLAKSNLANMGEVPGIVFAVEPFTLQTREGPATTGAVTLLGEDSRTANELLAAGDEGDGEDHHEAADWLRGYLTDNGGEAPRPDVLKAGRKEGFTEANLKTAAKRLRVVRSRRGFGGGSVWSLPEAVPHEEAQPPEVEDSVGQEAATQREEEDLLDVEGDRVECSVWTCREPATAHTILGGVEWIVCATHNGDVLAMSGDYLEVVA